MKRRILQTGLVLLAIFLLPATTLTVYELSSLNRDERILEEVYTKQLDVILFSVNRYSQDVADSWVNKLEAILKMPKSKQDEAYEAFLAESSSIASLFVADSLQDGQLQWYGMPEEEDWEKHLNIDSVLNENDEKITRLKTYLRGGYKKIEPLGNQMPQKLPLLIFLAEREAEDTRLFGIFIDPEIYIEQVLAPRLQAVGQEQLVISVYREGDKNPVYSTGEGDPGPEQQRKHLWLLPDYSLGIILEGKTLTGLVQSRSYTNLFLIFGMNIFLLLGIWWVFRNLRRELELAQNKSDFVSNVSHEIRTPLALISMFAETLEMDRVKSEEKKHEYYRIISQETRRLAGIVNKILNFSKMEAGKRSFQMAPTDLNAVAEEVMRSYSFHLTQNGFSYHFEPDAHLPLVQADSEAVSEALINLLDNAVKYSEGQKEIRVRTGQHEGFSYIEVRDQGMGIPEDQHKAIFEKFYRVSSGLVHNTKGTGLGLSLVQHIMEAHQGMVTLRSESGKGSCFRLSFPEETSQ